MRDILSGKTAKVAIVDMDGVLHVVGDPRGLLYEIRIALGRQPVRWFNRRTPEEIGAGVRLTFDDVVTTPFQWELAPMIWRTAAECERAYNGHTREHMLAENHQGDLPLCL